MLRSVVREFGDPSQVILLEDAPRPAPGPGEVELRILRTAINPSDLIPVTGAYRSRTTLPFVPGFEGVGVVVRTGPAVSGLREGDRVLPIGASGLWQQYLLRPAAWCFAVPGGLADEAAATSYINPLTAFRLIAALGTHFGAAAGRRIGVTAANSAIGRMLVHLLAEAGFRPVALLRSAESRDRFSARSPDVKTCVLGDASDAVPPEGLDGVLDAVGGVVGDRLIAQALRPGGAFVQYGALSGAQLDPRLVTERRDVAFSFLWLRNWIHATPRGEIEAAFARSFAGVASGALASAVDSTFPLADLAEALRRQTDPARRGKVLLAPGDAVAGC
ncbi:zinc-dependent alcohol dehydrogenase family protein [Rhizobium sp. TRM95111]|uniref:zinc-dependent alcohol dehydrogenase family protein n=1 Tax=Rhizobium alarense TaxID=2846851 RepID=UPI001F365976|nr:zinc-dependent alcohol dehydrogenase family protein [Rhizobium alarense]MCF3640618.1 zinc-dependent alcohol dehydrogenase family protein [Rhizobium alarense]